MCIQAEICTYTMRKQARCELSSITAALSLWVPPLASCFLRCTFSYNIDFKCCKSSFLMGREESPLDQWF